MSLEGWVGTTLACAVVDSRVLVGGRNSRVMALTLADGRQVVAKRHAPVRPGRLDSLVVESRALRFLDRHDANVPRLLAVDLENRCLVMTRVSGEAVSGEREEHVDALLDFLHTLDRIGEHKDARKLPPASEATFSLAQLDANLDARFERLQDAPDDDRVADEMRRFLDEDLGPARRERVAEAAAMLADEGVERDDELLAEHRRLSPSDFGFHNALMDADGRWSFVDFEYFGWDDPAKTLADLLLHPRVDLSPVLRRRWVEKRLATLHTDTTLPCRLRAFYPLFAIKWCLILLNEFGPQDRARRQQAGVDTVDARPAQLAKARRMLERMDDLDDAAG
ncbi:MAG: hypothetical protein AAGD38_05445 [Acidobacteriota bacterium]